MVGKTRKDELIADIRRVATQLEKTPSYGEYMEYGEYSSSPIYTHFDGWREARGAAGLDDGWLPPEEQTSDDELLDDLTAVANEVDGTPTREQYETRGGYHYSTLEERFGKWNDVLRAAGFTPNQERKDEETLLVDLQRVGKRVDGAPSKTEYNAYGEYHPATLIDRFGSWNAAKAEAGFEENNRNYNLTREELETDLQRVAEIVGRPPSKAEYTEYGEFSVRPFYDRFGSWTDAREALGLDDGPQRSTKISEEDLIRELRLLADEVEDTPTREQMRQRGRYHDNSYRRHFGSWNQAVTAAGLEPNEKEPQEVECEACDTAIKVHSWRRSQSNGSFFCSPECQKGENHPLWNDDREGYVYYGPDWPGQRRKRREEDGYQCVDCGMTQTEHLEEYGLALDVHHIVPVRQFESHEKANRLENLRTLCKPCHGKWEKISPLCPDTNQSG